MNDETQPIGNIKPQILTNTVIGTEYTLVNDPIALVNDPYALVGSQTTPFYAIRGNTSSNSPKGKFNPFNMRGNANGNAPKGSITQRH